MEIEVPYGVDKVNVVIDRSRLAGIVEANVVQVGDEMETIDRAIEQPINSKSFSSFLSNAKDVLFIVNDGTRPTPTAKILDVIYDRIKDKEIKFLVATGMHRSPTKEEFQFIFGQYYPKFKDLIYVHDAKKDEDIVYVGTSVNGTEMFVNKLGVEAHKMVIIGSVEPHYFAGYTGGRKSFLPGIASYNTIEQNHKYALRLQAQALALAGNPVHEDMIDALKATESTKVFSIQTVLDKNRKVYGCTAGHIHDSFYAAIEKADEVFCVPIKEKADIVVSVASYPMDVDLYQSQKALDNGKLALREGGVIIMVSKCRTGIGDETFFQLLASCQTPQQALDKISRDFKLGYHKAAKMAEVALWAEMWGVTDLQDKEMGSVFLRPFHDLQQAVEAALLHKRDDAKVLFLMDGSVTVPKVD